MLRRGCAAAGVLLREGCTPAAAGQARAQHSGGSEVVWTKAFVERLRKTSGVEEEPAGAASAVAAAADSGKSDERGDVLGAALQTHGLVSSSKPDDAAAAEKEKSAHVSTFGTRSKSVSHTRLRVANQSPTQEDPTKDLLAELQKIKDRMAILPIKSAGALYGPGEGVMQVYHSLKKDAEDKKKKDEAAAKERLHTRQIALKPGGFHVSPSLLHPHAAERREAELLAVKEFG